MNADTTYTPDALKEEVGSVPEQLWRCETRKERTSIWFLRSTTVVTSSTTKPIRAYRCAAAHFSQFMTHLSEKLGEKDCVIYMDNAPIHRAVRNFEGVHERHEIHRFDAPYSPQLNPVEGCFGIVKASVKRQLRDFNPELDPQNANFEGQTLTAYRQARLLALVPGALEELYKGQSSRILSTCRSHHSPLRRWITTWTVNIFDVHCLCEFVGLLMYCSDRFFTSIWSQYTHFCIWIKQQIITEMNL